MFLRRILCAAVVFSWGVKVSLMDEQQDSIYSEINAFRANPVAYIKSRNYQCKCTQPLHESYRQLNVSVELEKSSYFQAYTISSNECPISHETCFPYCGQFGGCSHINRMQSFLGGRQAHDLSEILIRGSSKVPKIMGLFLNSEGHCNHLLNCHLNAMGASFSHRDKNVVVVDLCYFEDNNDGSMM